MKIYVVGIGPGEGRKMTVEAQEAIRSSDLLVGYTVYVELVKELFPDKPVLSTPMKQEVQRCRLAMEEAASGKTVAVVCSGDAGVYGMAGLLLELSSQYPQVEIEVVAGVTAACSGAALLGAPLTHDFAVVSLSDLMTPWEVIAKRLECAAQGDFVICLYNPSSKKRADYLRRACEILLRCRSGETVCGVARNIGREGESCQVMSLRELQDYSADMFTTVFIGNSATKREGDWMVTPRGYRQIQ